jgi:hypothetical protein
LIKKILAEQNHEFLTYDEVEALVAAIDNYYDHNPKFKTIKEVLNEISDY